MRQAHPAWVCQTARSARWSFFYSVTFPAWIPTLSVLVIGQVMSSRRDNDCIREVKSLTKHSSYHSFTRIVCACLWTKSGVLWCVFQCIKLPLAARPCQQLGLRVVPRPVRPPREQLVRPTEGWHSKFAHLFMFIRKWYHGDKIGKVPVQFYIVGWAW